MSVGEVRDMNEDSPDGSPYGTLVKHDQSETKHDNCSDLVFAVSDHYTVHRISPPMGV
jgi:hypothetical protein